MCLQRQAPTGEGQILPWHVSHTASTDLLLHGQHIQFTKMR
jgi:hypothetical protein